MKRTLSLLAALCAPGAALANEPTAAVFEIGGYRGDAVRAAVMTELDQVVALIDIEQVSAKAEELEVDVDTEEGLMRIAESMGLELFVRGLIIGKGRRASVEIQVIGPDGLERGLARGKSPRSKRNRRRVAKKTAQLVQRALDQLEEEVLDETLEGPPEMQSQERTVIAPITVTPPPPTPASPPPVQEESTIDRPAPRADASGRSIAAHAGITVRARSAKLRLSDGRRAIHETGPFPEIAVRLEGKPFADDSWLSGFHAAVDFAIEVGLDSIERTEEIDTDALRAAATVGYLFDLGILDVGAAAGFGIDRFALSENRVLDSSMYSYVRVAALGRLTLFEAAVVELTAGLRPVVSTGELGDRFGQSSTALGFEIGGAIAHETEVGFTYGLSALFSGYTIRFGSSDRLSATGGFDSSIAVGLAVGWVIR